LLRDSEDKSSIILSLVDQNILQRILEKVFDPNEFLSDYGIRSLSKYYESHPYYYGSKELRYEPGETSDRSLYGGNSNWRGPIWFPVNFLLIEGLTLLGRFYGKDSIVINVPCKSKNNEIQK